MTIKNRLPLALSYDSNDDPSGLAEFLVSSTDLNDVATNHAPAANQVLAFSSTGVYAPSTIVFPAGGGGSFTCGDLASCDLSALRNVCNDAVAANGQVYAWNGTQFCPSTLQFVPTQGTGNTTVNPKLIFTQAPEAQAGLNVTSIGLNVTGPTSFNTTPKVNGTDITVATDLAAYATNVNLAATGLSLINTRTDLAATGLSLIGTQTDLATTGASLIGTQTDLATTGASLITTQTALAATGASLITTQTNLAATGLSLINTQTDLAATGLSLINTRTDLAATGLSLINTQTDLATTGASLIGTQTNLAATGLSLINTQTDLATTGASLITTQTALNATGASLISTQTALAATGAVANDALPKSTAGNNEIYYKNGSTPDGLATTTGSRTLISSDARVRDLSDTADTDPTAGQILQFRGGSYSPVDLQMQFGGITVQGLTAGTNNFIVSNAVLTPPGSTGKGDSTTNSFIFFSGTDASATEFVGDRFGRTWVTGPNQNIVNGNFLVYFSSTDAASGTAATELYGGPAQVLHRQVGAPIASSNSTSLAELVSYTLPANHLAVGDIDIRIRGRQLAQGSNLRWNFKIGGTNVLNSNISQGTFSDFTTYDMHIQISKTATDKQLVTASFRQATGSGSSAGRGSWAGIHRDGIITNDSVTADESTDLALSLEAQQTSSSSTVTVDHFRVTLMPDPI